MGWTCSLPGSLREPFLPWFSHLVAWHCVSKNNMTLNIKLWTLISVPHLSMSPLTFSRSTPTSFLSKQLTSAKLTSVGNPGRRSISPILVCMITFCTSNSSERNTSECVHVCVKEGRGGISTEFLHRFRKLFQRSIPRLHVSINVLIHWRKSHSQTEYQCQVFGTENTCYPGVSCPHVCPQ